MLKLILGFLLGFILATGIWHPVFTRQILSRSVFIIQGIENEQR